MSIISELMHKKIKFGNCVRVKVAEFYTVCTVQWHMFLLVYFARFEVLYYLTFLVY